LAPTFDRDSPAVIVVIHVSGLHEEHVEVAVSFSLTSGEGAEHDDTDGTWLESLGS
jgi:hypothetical protein